MLNKHNVTINRYTGSIVASSGIENKNKTAGRKKRSACCCSVCTYKAAMHKGPRTTKKTTELINLMYETRDRSNKRFYWVTLTTTQHKTGLSDGELYYRLKLWLQHRKGDRYICTVERQRETQDLHFHLIVEREKDYDIHKETARIAQVFGTTEHPALFDVKRIRNVQTLIGYIGKYVRKPLPSRQRLEALEARKDEINPKTGKKYGYKPPFSSLFWCRTLSYSGDLGRLYKERYHTFAITVPNHFLETHKEKLKAVHKNDFFVVYKYDISLWNLGHHYVRELLKSREAQHLARNELSRNIASARDDVSNHSTYSLADPRTAVPCQAPLFTACSGNLTRASVVRKNKTVPYQR